jgi:hypothetical protein
MKLMIHCDGDSQAAPLILLAHRQDDPAPYCCDRRKSSILSLMLIYRPEHTLFLGQWAIKKYFT